MRRTTVLATALVALAAGVAGCSSGDGEGAATATAPAPAATAPGAVGAPASVPTPAALEATLKAFTASMRTNPYGHSPERLSSLSARVEAFAAQLTALEASAATREGEPTAATVRALREAEGHLREYLRHGGEADTIAMQKDIYRYLWSLNRLPEELGQV